MEYNSAAALLRPVCHTQSDTAPYSKFISFLIVSNYCQKKETIGKNKKQLTKTQIVNKIINIYCATVLFF